MLFSPPQSGSRAAAPAAGGRGVSAGARVAERPLYSKAGLARALREGVDPAGVALDPLMPRYALTDAELTHVHAHLAALSSEPAPGVSDTAIHFATVIAPGVSPDKRRALLDVLQGFFGDRNGGTRKETRRREIGHEQMYRAYRRWELHTWELGGPADTWRDQLGAFYRQQPVFAVIGGIGAGSWEPVHAFCEEQELPCMFPDVDYPVAGGPGYYPFYFSRGLTLEAEVLARHLLEDPQLDATAVIVQVYRDTTLGRRPARALRAALQGRRARTLVDLPVDDAAGAAAWHSALAGHGGPKILVMWLEDADVRSLALAGAPPPGLGAIYLSAGRLDRRRPRLPAGWMGKTHMVYPFALPDRHEKRLARMKAWLRARRIPAGDERTQANALFAATVTGDAITAIGENYSRDYFIERVEQMTQNSVSSSIYPHLSLGPGQRFASRGAYVVRFPADEAAPPVAVSDWLIP